MPPVSASSVTPEDLVEAVRTGIAALADPAKAATMQAYLHLVVTGAWWDHVDVGQRLRGLSRREALRHLG